MRNTSPTFMIQVIQRTGYPEIDTGPTVGPAPGPRIMCRATQMDVKSKQPLTAELKLHELHVIPTASGTGLITVELRVLDHINVPDDLVLVSGEEGPLQSHVKVTRRPSKDSPLAYRTACAYLDRRPKLGDPKGCSAEVTLEIDEVVVPMERMPESMDSLEHTAKAWTTFPVSSQEYHITAYEDAPVVDISPILAIIGAGGLGFEACTKSRNDDDEPSIDFQLADLFDWDKFEEDQKGGRARKTGAVTLPEADSRQHSCLESLEQ
ncbi:hypothetical protein C8R46DRAFT_1042985 [Mycena filopes]|nr:hypothetical protein C8R46DRAFT_1042985 [Mycena filopes]